MLLLGFYASSKNSLHFLQSRERLVKSLRAMNAGDAADQVIRQVDRLTKHGDRFIRDARASKVRGDLLLVSCGCKAGGFKN